MTARLRASPEAPPTLVGDSVAMCELLDQVAAVSDRRCNVLIAGETGTGKELVARRIHADSGRADGPFVPVDCAALPENLIESQLFGHVRGAFTGAEQPMLGFVRAADGGTLFLDEIGELPAAAQAKLLRCIQQRTVVPVGSVKPLPVNVRIIAATHRDLHAMAQAGTFREDLYYRLNVAQLSVPPLRRRREDIEALAEHFLLDLAELYDEPMKRLSASALALLRRHRWPGNVRELGNAIEYAHVFGGDRTIGPDDLPETLRRAPLDGDGDDPIVTLETAERRLITRALRATGGNQSQAAKLINVERHRLRRKIMRYGLDPLIHPGEAT